MSPFERELLLSCGKVCLIVCQESLMRILGDLAGYEETASGVGPKRKAWLEAHAAALNRQRVMIQGALEVLGVDVSDLPQPLMTEAAMGARDDR